MTCAHVRPRGVWKLLERDVQVARRNPRGAQCGNYPRQGSQFGLVDVLKSSSTIQIQDDESKHDMVKPPEEDGAIIEFVINGASALFIRRNMQWLCTNNTNLNYELLQNYA